MRGGSELAVEPDDTDASGQLDHPPDGEERRLGAPQLLDQGAGRQPGHRDARLVPDHHLPHQVRRDVCLLVRVPPGLVRDEGDSDGRNWWQRPGSRRRVAKAEHQRRSVRHRVLVMLPAGVRLRRHGVRLAIAVAAVSAPLAAVLVESGTGMAAAPIMSQGAGCSGNIGWSNANQTIAAGDSITWSNCTGGYHQLQSTSSGWCLANQSTAGSAPTGWTYTCRFTAPGTYTYWCSVHTSAMTGTI